jgi:hypothetical protein
MIYHPPDIDPTIMSACLKNSTVKSLELIPNKVVNKCTNAEYIHEHIYDTCHLFQLDHKCGKSLLINCVTCNSIFCNYCGKRIML